MAALTNVMSGSVIAALAPNPANTEFQLTQDWLEKCSGEKAKGCPGMRRRRRTGERAEGCTSEGTDTLDSPVFFSSQQQDDRDLIISVLRSLSKERFQSLWDGMENSVPVSELAWTLSSWVKQSAKLVLPQAMVEVNRMRATVPVCMGASPELFGSTRVRMDQVLETLDPGTFTSVSKCPPERHGVVPRLHQDKNSSRAALTEEDRNGMGDSWFPTPIGVTRLETQMGKCKSGASGGFPPSFSESEHSQTTSGGLSDTLCSVSVKGVSPGDGKSKVVLQLEARAKTYTHAGGLTCGSLPTDMASVGLHCVDSGRTSVSSTSPAMDALKGTMERMVLCVDNARAAQERLEALASSGVLRPFIQDLVDQLQEVISCRKTSAPFHIQRSASDPVISLTRGENRGQRGLAMHRGLEITLAYTQKVVRSLLRDLLIALPQPWAKNEKGACFSKTSLRPSAKVCADVVEVFTVVLARHVMASLPERQADHLSPSPSSASLQSHSTLASGSIASVSLGPPHAINLNFEGEDYRCLVATLVVKLLLKVSEATEGDHLLGIPGLSLMLTNRVLFEFCAMSGLSRSEAYPPKLAIPKVYRVVYRKLLAEFVTKEELKRALCAQRLAFSKRLVYLLCDELLKQCHNVRVANLSSSNRKVMNANVKHEASIPYSGKNSERKISTKASFFFRGRHSSKKLFCRTNQVMPDWGVAHHTTSASVEYRDGGQSSSVSLNEEVTASRGHLKDITIDNSGSGDGSLGVTVSVDKNSSPTLFSRMFDRLSTVLDRSL